MEILKDVVPILHLLGLAAIIGGVLVQMRQTPKRVDALVVHGALSQLVLAQRNRKAEAVATLVWATIGLLTVADIAIAVTL